jgi:O-acetyl-ADP-ribose deacetylase (regulator of RNase III)
MNKSSKKGLKTFDRIKIVRADITTINVDAIVNAANVTLLGGGGVDGAIHKAAGSQLLEECKKLDGCEIGEAKLTKGYNLPAKHVIHTVGPHWQGGSKGEAKLLASCYKESLKLASKHGIKNLAFPSISTGTFGYPIERAAPIALRTVFDYLGKHDEIEKVTFVVFSDKDFNAYDNALYIF